MFYIENNAVRFTGLAISLAAMIFFCFPFQFGIKNIGNLFGIFISQLFLIFFIFNRQISSAAYHLWQHTVGKIIISAVVSFLIAGFILAAVISAFMVKTAFNRPDSPKTAILLGCKVNGLSPSLMLKRRLDTAYEYLTENKDAIIIVSGGKGENEDISEAECMKEFLVSKGISSSRVIMEDKSSSTLENLEFSKKLLEEYGLRNEVVIITDSFHQLRASMIAKNLDLKTWNVSAHTPFYLLPTYWVREWFGITWQFISR